MRGTNLKDRIMAKLETWILNSWLPRLCEVPSEELLDDVNAALRTVPTGTITETNQLIYSMAAVISEVLGYNFNSHKEQYP